VFVTWWGARITEVKTFKTTTQELMALSEWLSSQGVTHIAMEATGVYWKPVWHILSDGEFELVLANAAHVKNVPGRKTDVNDATWLADLMAHGLIRASFVPDEADPADARSAAHPQAVRARTLQPHPAHPEDAGGCQHQARFGGHRHPGPQWPPHDRGLDRRSDHAASLGTLAHRRIHASADELEAALRGRVTKHHRFLLKLHLDQIDAFDAAIAASTRRSTLTSNPFA
jgi:transposase